MNESADVQSHTDAPVVDKHSVFMDLVLQREIKGEVFGSLVVVDLHAGSVFIRLKVLYDVREPDGQAVVPVHRK